jgi:small subunit ribosomal protein S6
MPAGELFDRSIISWEPYMNGYETLLAVRSTLSDEEITGLIGKFSGAVSKGNGEMVAQENWGRRKLAYEIGKEQKGIYLIFHYKAPGAVIFELERELRLNEKVLKYLTVRIEADQLGKTAPIKEEKPVFQDKPVFA